MYLGRYVLMALSVALAASVVCASAPDAPPAPDDSTLLLWHFDEGEGEVAGDASAHGLDGAISGAEWVEGRFGKALQWGEDNGRVAVDADLSAITDRFTLECWIRLDKYPTGEVPFWTSDVAGKLGSLGMNIRPPGVLYIGVQLGQLKNYLLGHEVIPLNEWTHVALVYDGPARKIGTFVNGMPDLEVDVPPDAAPVNLDPDRMFYARSYSGNDEKLVGAIDEVCLSNRVKTFGNHWTYRVFLHALRYSSELLLASAVPPGLADPPVTYHLRVTDQAGAPVVQADVPAEQAVAGGAVVPAPGLAEGTYRALVTCTLASGAEETLWDRQMLYTPPDTSVFDIRPDNVLVREGKPLFPLVVYHVRQKDLGVIADSALNTANSWTTTYPPDWERPGDGVGFVEACGAAGLMAVCGGGGLYGPGVQERTGEHYRGSRDLLFYYVADEPSGPGRQPEDMLECAEAWNRYDPTHPAFLLQNRPAEFAPYAPACDIFATDCYPIRRAEDTNMRPVSVWTRTAVEAVRWRKPVWLALQCYTVRSTEPSTASRDGLPRLPTADELRCMSYIALAEGARGLLYYAFDDTYYTQKGIRGVNLAEEHPDFWKQMKGVLAELALHSDIWTMPYADLPEPTCSNEKIIVQRRPYAEAGKLYVLVVNPERDVQTAPVKIEGLTGTLTVADALGGPPAEMRDGLITAELQPLQSACYVVPMD